MGAQERGRPTVAEMWEDVQKRVVPGEGGCLVWTGATQRGYGAIRRRGTTYRAHRIAYEAVKGAIPDGMCVDHMCHDPRECDGGLCVHRLCVNPDHLRLLTHEQNSALMSPKHKPFCVNGHARTPENLRLNSYGRQVCIPCSRMWRMRSYYRNRRPDVARQIRAGVR